MKTLIVANWKMNPQKLVEAKRLFNSFRKISNNKEIELVVCPPFVFLIALKGKIKLGAQNCFWKEKGAFTGEISAKMLKGLGCSHVIIGHSERRRYFIETNEIITDQRSDISKPCFVINEKIKACLRQKLKPILCVGETKEEKDKVKTQDILKSQIQNCFKGISKGSAKNIIIAYEPVWAVNTKKACEVDEAMTNLLLIRKILSQIYSCSLAQDIQILYGGGISSKNVSPYIKEAGFQGLLVGAASLDSKEFIKIVKSI